MNIFYFYKAKQLTDKQTIRKINLTIQWQNIILP